LLIGNIAYKTYGYRREIMRLRKESDNMQEEEILLVAQVSDALAHPARIKIYQYIMKCNKERTSVCNKDVVAVFDYSQATISQHLKKLIQADLIQVQKNDKFSIYYANMGILMKYLDATKKFSTFQA
jgi:DNA-binding transcriptional ArsR family regulator